MDSAEIKARIEELEGVEEGGSVEDRLNALRKGLAEVEEAEAREQILAAKKRERMYQEF